MRTNAFEYEDHYTMKKNRLKVLKANNYSCKHCGGKATIVHHIDGTKWNHDPDNLLPLCHKCHTKVHAVKRARWDIEFIEVAMMQRGMDKGDLAKKTGLTRATITNILKTGATKNSTMKRIADALDYPIEVFLSADAAEKLDQLEIKARRVSVIRQFIDKKLESVTDPVLKRRFHIWITNDIRRKFNVKSYYNVPKERLDEAIEFVQQWRIPGSGKEDEQAATKELPRTGTE